MVMRKDDCRSIGFDCSLHNEPYIHNGPADSSFGNFIVSQHEVPAIQQHGIEILPVLDSGEDVPENIYSIFGTGDSCPVRSPDFGRIAELHFRYVRKKQVMIHL